MIWMIWWDRNLRCPDGLGLTPIVSCHPTAIHRTINLLTVDVRSQAGIGKSSPINRVFRAKEAVWGHGQRCVQLS
jgi:hypothetical protein